MTGPSFQFMSSHAQLTLSIRNKRPGDAVRPWTFIIPIINKVRTLSIDSRRRFNIDFIQTVSVSDATGKEYLMMKKRRRYVSGTRGHQVMITKDLQHRRISKEALYELRFT